MKVELQCDDSIAIPDGCKATIKDGNVVFEKEEQEFKRGDVIVSKWGEILLVDIHSFEDIMLRSFVHIKQDGTLYESSYSLWNSEYLWRLATEEEKQLLFDKMKEQGLKWDKEEKRVEKIRWRASSDERYYYINHSLACLSDIEESHIFDDERWEANNYFRTEEQAEEAKKRVEETLRNYHEEIE